MRLNISPDIYNLFSMKRSSLEPTFQTVFPIGAILAVASVLLLGSVLVFGRSQTNTDGAQASAMASPGSPEPLPGLPGYTSLDPLTGPIRIGIQPGHWRIDELPDELARLRTSTGAAYGSLTELDLNLAVSRLLADRLNAEGFAAELVPAGIPAGYRADLFVSVHADRADQPNRRGWKLSPPWRPSRRSRELAAAFAASFRESGLPEDFHGITANMRGYFGFSWWRFANALSPYTPAVLVEMGFMGNAEDRTRMRDRPGFYADIMLRGIKTFLGEYTRDDLGALVPTLFQARYAGLSGTSARAAPGFGSAVLERLEPGQRLLPVDSGDDGWFEIYSRKLRRGIWIHESELN